MLFRSEIGVLIKMDKLTIEMKIRKEQNESYINVNVSGKSRKNCLLDLPDDGTTHNNLRICHSEYN